MGLLSWIVFGLIAGALAKLLMPGKDPSGLIVTMLIGIAGALVGGYLGALMGLGGIEGFTFGSLVTAILGTLLLLGIYRYFKGPRTTH